MKFLCLPLRPGPAFILISGILLLSNVEELFAAGKKRPQAGTRPTATTTMKRAVEVSPVTERFISLPDPKEPFRWYGENVRMRLIEELNRAGVFVVLNPQQILASSALALGSGSGDGAAPLPDPCLFSGGRIASSRIELVIDELAFSSGSRAGREFSGFRRGSENPYNSGLDSRARNEFLVGGSRRSAPGLERTFADADRGLHTGLELGHELNFDALWVGASLKHVEYRASIGLEVKLRHRHRALEVEHITGQGSGFYFDLSAHVAEPAGDFEIGVNLAQKTALLKAFDQVIEAASKEIAKTVSRVPLVASLFGQCGGDWYASVGSDFGVQAGQWFYNATQKRRQLKAAVFVVDQVFQKTSKLRLLSGEVSQMVAGDELVSLEPGETPPSNLAQASLALSIANRGEAAADRVARFDANLPVAAGLARFIESTVTRILKGVTELVTLPYRIYRYHQYDQKYKGGEFAALARERALELSKKSWAHASIGHPGYLEACVSERCLGSRGTIVALIDSGIDYNHRELRRNLYWDSVLDAPGFDFYSHDKRPFDDHSHGTEIASVIAGGGEDTLGVAPNVTLLPIKVFSPYGNTNSAAIYSGFEYAVKSKAKVIVLGWATTLPSKALEDGLRLAEQAGALVVASAGDGGLDLARKPFYPAAWGESFQNLLVVGGLNKKNLQSRVKYGASNHGRKVDLWAPSEHIRVATPRNRTEIRSHAGLAAGFVAGAAALLKSLCPRLSALELKETLLGGAVVAGREEALYSSQVYEIKALSLIRSVDYLNQVCN
ncbi:MAG: S8 family serine peptidase [Bdellovibrionota bacterium]